MRTVKFIVCSFYLLTILGCPDNREENKKKIPVGSKQITLSELCTTQRYFCMPDSDYAVVFYVQRPPFGNKPEDVLGHLVSLANPRHLPLDNCKSVKAKDYKRNGTYDRTLTIKSRDIEKIQANLDALIESKLTDSVKDRPDVLAALSSAVVNEVRKQSEQKVTFTVYTLSDEVLRNINEGKLQDDKRCASLIDNSKQSKRVFISSIAVVSSDDKSISQLNSSINAVVAAELSKANITNSVALSMSISLEITNSISQSIIGFTKSNSSIYSYGVWDKNLTMADIIPVFQPDPGTSIVQSTGKMISVSIDEQPNLSVEIEPYKSPRPEPS